MSLLIKYYALVGALVLTPARPSVYLVVGVFQLAVVDPAVKEVEDGVRHQAEDVLHQRPHLGVARLAVGVDGRGQLAPFAPCSGATNEGVLAKVSSVLSEKISKEGKHPPWQKSTRAASVFSRTLGSYIHTRSLRRVRLFSVHMGVPCSSSTCSCRVTRRGFSGGKISAGRSKWDVDQKSRLVGILTGTGVDHRLAE